MTNEEFMKNCQVYLPVNSMEHAKKLVAIAEDVKRIADNVITEENEGVTETYIDTLYFLQLANKLENLEHE